MLTPDPTLSYYQNWARCSFPWILQIHPDSHLIAIGTQRFNITVRLTGEKAQRAEPTCFPGLSDSRRAQVLSGAVALCLDVMHHNFKGNMRQDAG
jgi:hypothetical protein